MNTLIHYQLRNQLRYAAAVILFGLSTVLMANEEAVNNSNERAPFKVPNLWFGEGGDPPPNKPYQLPRFDDHYQEDHYTPIAPIKTAPYVNAEKLFTTITRCYPEMSKFGLELNLEANYRNRNGYDTVNGTSIGQHYIGIVARMPLYSASDLNREREREHSRRSLTAGLIGNFMSQLAKRNHAVRELGLYSSLEARSQVRVMQGVTETSEQVRYLERVAKAQRDLITAEAMLVRYRLEMVAMCANGKAGEISHYIKRLSALPKGE